MEIFKVLMLCIVIIGLPALAFLVGHKLQEKVPESKYKSRLKLTNKGLISLFAIVFCFMCLYRTTNIGVWLVALTIPLLWMGFSKSQLLLPETGNLKIQKYQIFWVLTMMPVGLMFLLCLKPVYNMNWFDSAMLESNRISIIYLLVLAWVIVYLFTSIFSNNKVNGIILFTSCFVWLLVFVMKILWRYTYGNPVEIGFFSLFSDQVILLNCGILLAISVLFFAILGKGWGIVLNVILYAFLFLSNFLKLRFHDTFFTWFDLLQVKELILIGREFLTVPIVVGIIVAIALAIFLVVHFRKRIKIFLRPRIMVLPSLAFIVLIGSIYIRITDGQYGYLDVYKRTWENEAVNVRLNGLVVNLVLNANALQEIVMDEPEGYSQEAANDLLEQFQESSTNSSVSEEKPDVILIMGESLFDLDGVDGLQFDKDIDATIDAYSTSAMLSPRYGGYTSAMEFEALTGLTLAFMPPSLTPFTTYFNNPEDDFPSIVQEFKKNGYSSVAIHPDLADFYNRTIVYKNMGFDDYQAINSFTKTEENTTLNDWITDDELGNRMHIPAKQHNRPEGTACRSASNCMIAVCV